jgi:hypothetical protein
MRNIYKKVLNRRKSASLNGIQSTKLACLALISDERGDSVDAMNLKVFAALYIRIQFVVLATQAYTVTNQGWLF